MYMRRHCRERFMHRKERKTITTGTVVVVGVVVVGPRTIGMQQVPIPYRKTNRSKAVRTHSHIIHKYICIKILYYIIICCICLCNDDIIVIISCNVPIYFLMSVARNNRVNRVYYFKRARRYRQIIIMKKKSSIVRSLVPNGARFSPSLYRVPLSEHRRYTYILYSNV